jgi:hypothetical protein
MTGRYSPRRKAVSPAKKLLGLTAKLLQARQNERVLNWRKFTLDAAAPIALLRPGHIVRVHRHCR